MSLLPLRTKVFKSLTGDGGWLERGPHSLGRLKLNGLCSVKLCLGRTLATRYQIEKS